MFEATLSMVESQAAHLLSVPLGISVQLSCRFSIRFRSERKKSPDTLTLLHKCSYRFNFKATIDDAGEVNEHLICRKISVV